MHVLTKIFIVLVSLLAVMLVPLVVVYAYNENSFHARYQAAEAAAAAARSDLGTERASHLASESRSITQIQELEGVNLDLRRQVDQQATEVGRLQTRLTESESMDAEIRGKLTTLTSAVDAGQKLTESLINELRSLRSEALTAERQRVQLDETLRDTRAQLDGAVEARRALQEELQRLKDDHAAALDKIQRYVAAHGEIDDSSPAAGAIGERPVDRDLDTKIISVRITSDQKYAEIDAGSRDGVQEGWVLTIGSEGQFIGRLRIISVDINRATGVVELEDENARGAVKAGMHVYARRRK